VNAPPDDDLLSILSQIPPEELPEELRAMFFPYGQEQGVLDQEMALAQQLRQRGPERSSPVGAALGGLSNALGNAGGAYRQTETLGKMRDLNTKMQEDAVRRTRMAMDRDPLVEMLRQKGRTPGFVSLDPSVA
jgi:hypothetical protein